MPFQLISSTQPFTLPSNAAIGTVGGYGWAEGGTGGTSVHGSAGGSGGGGGAFGAESILAGVGGGTILSCGIGTGGSSTDTTITGGTVPVTAAHGGNGVGTTAGPGGAAGSNSIAKAGGNGASGTGAGAAGGGGAGSTGAGGNASGTTPGAAGTGGTVAGQSLAGNAGAASPGSLNPGIAGAMGAGGSGGGNGGTINHPGGQGGAGQVLIVWAVISYNAAGYISMTARAATSRKAVSAARGVLSFVGAPLPIGPVNVWSGTFAQPAVFGNTPPALQSLVVALTPGAGNVGGGSGVPTAGNWLFCVTGWNQTSLPAVAVGNADDLHSFWRPAQVSQKTGADVRCSVWYTPNLARSAQDVYAAPSGAVAGMACLVIEVAGIGPWDTVTGIVAAYVASGTSLPLALPAPSSASFVLAALAGDLTGVSQALNPGTPWRVLPSVTASNGADHSCDTVITAAYLSSNTGSISITGTAGSATDLAGVIVSVEIDAPSPIPVSRNVEVWGGGPTGATTPVNTAWPWLELEMAPGSGYETPADEMTWRRITKRFWSWHEVTGIQYQLGALQASDVDLELDNWDGSLSPGNPGSVFYSNALNLNMSFNRVYPFAGTSGWTPVGGAAIAQSPAQAFASAPDAVANYSMMVTPDGVTANPGASSEMDPVTAGSIYSASAWFYAPAGWASGGQVAITWFNSSNAQISVTAGTAVVLPVGAWTQAVLLGATAPAGAVHATITAQEAGTPSAPFYVAEAALVSGSAAVQTGLVTTGVPVRLRIALGTIGGVTVNRWYTIARNFLSYPEKRNKARRGFVGAKATDVWSVASASLPTPYRGEVEQDQPYAWWPGDDQPGAAGTLPTFLRNAATGNTVPLNIVLSPNGGQVQNQQLVIGGAVVLGPSNPGTIATYAVAQDGGWMPGDPQSSPQSSQSGNPTTAQPGSASWQQQNESGTTGAYGFYLLAHDAAFPPLAQGMSLELWFKMPFFGTATLSNPNLGGPQASVCTTPYTSLTIAELMTASAPVAMLQLDLTGHLSWITYNGGTPTSHSIYSTSDLRSATYHHLVVTTDGNNWTAYLDGGLLATVSGTGAGMTSAWSYLLYNGDFGSNGGTNPASFSHGGNISLSHMKVYPQVLPAWRVRAHYAAAVTAFGTLPAPAGVTPNFVHSGDVSGDGSNAVGTVNGSAGYPPNTQTVMSAVVVAQAGAYQSAPSAWAAVADWASSVAMAAWVQYSGIAPFFAIYTSGQLGNETQAAIAAGAGDGFVSGYGSGASTKGFCHYASGDGSSPPAAATPLGDTVGQRLERLAGYGGITSPNRAIDPAPLLVQAATDVGGAQMGSANEAIVDSDEGMYAIDSNNTPFYRSRPHLSSDTPIWQLGPNVANGQIPYLIDQEWGNDPNRVYTDIEIQQFAPDGSVPPVVTPSNGAAVKAAQQRYGVRSLQVMSYLQDSTKLQLMADNLFQNYGTNRRRVALLTVEAASHPSAFLYVISAQIGDLCQVSDVPLGAPFTNGVYRITEITRSLSYGANGAEVTGALQATLDYEPSRWS